MRALLPRACVFAGLSVALGMADWVRASADDCASATPVSEGVFAYDTRNATDDGPNTCASVGFKTVWFAYTASVSGNTTVSTCASNFGPQDQQSVIAVHEGGAATCASPLTIDCSFSGCGIGSSLTFEAGAGQVYLIQIGGGCEDCTSSGLLTIASDAVAPANDACATPRLIGEGVHAISNVGATLDAALSSSCGETVGDVWFRYVPPVSGLAEIATCGSAFNTIVTIFDGTACTPLDAEIACSDDDCRSQSYLLAPVTAGQAYLIQVAGSATSVRDPAQGVGKLVVHVLNQPDNDACADAMAVGEGDWPYTNVDSTTDGPQDCEDLARDVWFSYTPSVTGLASITAAGFDTIMSAYTGGCGAPNQIGCNNDYASVEASIYVPVEAGVPVLILVGGNGGTQGSGVLRISAAAAPANDLCENATPIGLGSFVFSTRGANTDGPVPLCVLPTDQVYNDIWYEFTAPVSGDVVASLCGTLYDTILTAHVGACPDGFTTEAACDDDSCGDGGPSVVIVHDVAAGQRVLLRVGGIFHGFVGEGVLSVTMQSPTCTLLPLGDSIFEAEECSADDNGGCASDTPVFQPLSCAAAGTVQTIFGSAWVASGIRDTDWYRITLPVEATVTWGGDAEFPAVFSIRGGVCQGDELARAVVRSPCEGPSEASIRLSAGTYNLVVTPSDFWGGASCAAGSDYLAVLSVTCDPSGACCGTTSGPCAIRTQPECAASGGTYRGDNTVCDASEYLAARCEGPMESIEATGTAGPQCDQCQVQAPIGFPFTFYGRAYGEVWVNANGFISMGPVSRNVDVPHPLPRNWNPNGVIAPFWTDLVSFHTGSVKYETRGEPGMRRFIVQWTGVPRGFDVDSNTFQVILHEAGQMIDFRYGTVSGSFDGQTVIGVEDADGRRGTMFDATSPFIGGSCLRWSSIAGPSACCPADFNGSGTISVQDIFDYLATYFSGNLTADFNRSGEVSVQDIFDFLAAWFAGC